MPRVTDWKGTYVAAACPMLPKRRPSGHHVLVYLLALVVVTILLVLGSVLLRALLHQRGIL